MDLPWVAIGLAGKRPALTAKQGQALERGLGARPTHDPPGSECACLGPQGSTRSQSEEFIWEVTPGSRGEGRAGKAAGKGRGEAVAPLGARDVDGAAVLPQLPAVPGCWRRAAPPNAWPNCRGHPRAQHRCRLLRSGRVGCRVTSWAGRAAAAHGTRERATSPARAHCYVLGTRSARHFSRHMNLKQN